MLPAWDLSDLYICSNDPLLLSDKQTLSEKTMLFSKAYKGQLTSAQNVLNAVTEFEAIQNLSTKIGVYARLLSFIHLDKPEVQSFFQEIVEFLTQIEQPLTFFTLELNAIDETVLQQYFLDEPKLSFYKPWFRRLRFFKPYQLDEKLEQLLNDKSITSTQMWMRLYDESISKLKFHYEGTEFGIAGISDLLSHKSEDVRKKAAHSIQQTLKNCGDIFTTITNVLAKDLEISDTWRGFKHLGDSRHLSNDVEADVVNNLIQTVKQNYGNLSHRFYKLKAKLLNVEKINYWDRNAPLPFDDDTTYSFDEAKDIVLNAYGDFDDRIKSLVQKFFDNPWIDAKESPSKYPGAFNMPTFKGHHPYILLNFKGKLRDVTTLAHELGHGIHSLLGDHLGIFMSNAPLTLCETASVFGEMLTFQYLLKQCHDKKTKIKALESKLSDMINTVVRQIAFFDFEYKIHQKRREGKELSRKEMNEIWLNIQKEALGPSVIVDENVEEFWMTIPHFIHSPFYVYAYAFGDCLVNSLYQKYQTEPDGFQDKYLDLLKAGGSLHHKELLEPFNLNASDSAFWQNGLSVVINLLNQLEDELTL
ncbi:MAG: M3 family oligoendopeptidase [Proteobacteria bacterium]|nr:M3 family oligoendopeptidase [Pseudomonadota bacterium]